MPDYCLLAVIGRAFTKLNTMNEAKEKANELGNKFYQGSVFDYDQKGHLDEIIKAKNRTKICVQEILDAIQGESSNEKWNFWNDVMSEIDGL